MRCQKKKNTQEVKELLEIEIFHCTHFGCLLWHWHFERVQAHCFVGYSSIEVCLFMLNIVLVKGLWARLLHYKRWYFKMTLFLEGVGERQGCSKGWQLETMYLSIQSPFTLVFRSIEDSTWMLNTMFTIGSWSLIVSFLLHLF
jgi:hypothetical protein